MIEEGIKTAFYNTTRLRGNFLNVKIEKCKNQDEIVLEIFRHFNPFKGYTPFEVLWQFQKFSNKNPPITSIRRSMTNLTKNGFLVKTDIRRIGEFGDENFCWRLNVGTEKNGQINLF